MEDDEEREKDMGENARYNKEERQRECGERKERRMGGRAGGSS